MWSHLSPSFLASHGVLSYFLPMVVGWLGKRYAHAPQLPLSTRLFTVLRDSLASSVDDFTTLVLILGLVIVLALSWKRLSSKSRGFLGWMIFLILATPLLFNLSWALCVLLLLYPVCARLTCIFRWLVSSLSQRPSAASSDSTLCSAFDVLCHHRSRRARGPSDAHSCHAGFLAA